VFQPLYNATNLDTGGNTMKILSRQNKALESSTTRKNQTNWRHKRD